GCRCISDHDATRRERDNVDAAQDAEHAQPARRPLPGPDLVRLERPARATLGEEQRGQPEPDEVADLEPAGQPEEYRTTEDSDVEELQNGQGTHPRDYGTHAATSGCGNDRAMLYHDRSTSCGLAQATRRS